MELEKVAKKLSGLSLKLENAYINDINNIIDEMFCEYDIHYKDQNIPVDKKVVINKFKRVFNKHTKNNDKICLGISKNGNKCVRKSLPENDYCGTHAYLAFRFAPKVIDQEPMFIIEKKDTTLTHTSEKNMELLFIDDTFYYVDGRYAYNKSDKEKAGVFDINTNSYYITDDPFILNP